ncbi:hypothetical protein COB52_04110 [Candidatus Kaiserbacteria bacterium]|nr:MAG: hypothetical protein COB52_04110 [Candidatus Kaiserbacteria bacterium]
MSPFKKRQQVIIKMASMIDSDMRDWTIKNGYFEWNGKNRLKSSETHRLLSGGVLYIPSEKMDDFFEIYTQSIKNKQPVFVTETTTPIFKLFIDLDFCNLEIIPNEKIIEHCKYIQGIIGEFFKNIYSVEERIAIISISPPKEKNKNGAIYQANGIHMNWPNILVDIHDALLLRKAIIYAFESRYGRRPFYNTWDQVVDESIYHHGGLRMIGSRKTKICKYCKNKPAQRSKCVNCSAHGRIYFPHVYELLDVIDGNEQQTNEYYMRLKENILELVKETSIKSSNRETGHDSLCKSKNLPLWMPKKLSKKDMNEISDGQPKKKKKMVDPPGKEDIDGMSQFSSNRELIYEDDKRFQGIRGFINSQLPTDYADCIVELNRCAGGAYYVARTDSSMCMNFEDAPRRYHHSNTIYFYISPKGLFQKCFCRCDTTEERIRGKCSDYISSKYSLTQKVKKLLFSEGQATEDTFRGPTANASVLINIDKPDFKSKYIVLNTRSGTKEPVYREKRLKSIDDLLDRFYEEASGQGDYERRKFRYKKDK